MRRTALAARLAASAYMKEPTLPKQHIEDVIAEHKACNEDAAANLTSDFFELQRNLWSYRIVRLDHEIRAFFSSPLDACPAWYAWPLHIIALLAVYHACTCLARCSLTPLELPPEPQADEPKSTAK